MNSDQSNIRRDAIEKIRTIYWFEGLRIKLGVKSALAVQKIIDPGSLSMNMHGEPTHSSKWSEYRRGKHSPGRTTVNESEQVVVGSAREINHVLWKALKGNPIGSQASGLLRQLNPKIQAIAFDEDNQPYTHASRQFLGKLERRASLDSLACLTILLLVNKERGNDERVWAYAESIFKVLLILGYHFEERNISESIFRLYVERIFCLAKYDGKSFYLGGYPYLLWSQVLYEKADIALQTTNPWANWPDKAGYMWKTIRGDHGILKFQLEPLIGPDLEIGPPTHGNLLLLERGVQVRKWSLGKLQQGVDYAAPPEE